MLLDSTLVCFRNWLWKAFEVQATRINQTLLEQDPSLLLALNIVCLFASSIIEYLDNKHMFVVPDSPHLSLGCSCPEIGIDVSR